jgi:predicted aspartyl protease
MDIRQFTLLAAGALAMLSGTTAHADDAATALLQKHRAFVGWQFGDGSVKSLALERQYVNPKGTVSHAIERRIGLAYRRDYIATSSDDYSGAVGFTGHVFWSTNQNGFTVPYIGNFAKASLITDALFMEGSSELPAELHGQATIDGKAVSVIRVSMSGATPVDLYEDESGAYLRAVVDPGGSEETRYDIHSYTDIAPGKKMIGSWSVDGSKGVYSYTKATPNARIDDAELHPPAAQATWTFRNDQPQKIKVTVGRIYVDAVVNGVKGRFILDTGASSIVLTDEFANRAHVKTVTHSQAIGIGGETKTLVRTADTIDFGGNTLSNVTVQTLNQSFDDEKFNENPVGLIGFDLFAGAIVSLDTSNQTIRIQDPSAAISPPANGVPVAVDLSRRVPTVPMTINGKADVNAEFDTGNTFYVLVSKQLRDHGVAMAIDNSRVGYLASHMIIAGVGGEEEVTCGHLDQITLGPIVYQAPAACESNSYGPHEALIGFDFLQHFDYIFDYPHSQIVMIPHKD